MESVLLKKPTDVTLTDYFNTLNVFDKRTLINELSDVKTNYDDAIKSFMPYYMTVIVCCILGLLISYSTVSLITFGLLFSIVTIFLIKNVRITYKFRIVIDYLNKNM